MRRSHDAIDTACHQQRQDLVCSLISCKGAGLTTAVFPWRAAGPLKLAAEPRLRHLVARRVPFHPAWRVPAL